MTPAREVGPNLQAVRVAADGSWCPVRRVAQVEPRENQVAVVVIVTATGSFLLGLLMYNRPDALANWIRKRGLEEWSFLSMDPKGISTRGRGIGLIFIGATVLAVSITKLVLRQ